MSLQWQFLVCLFVSSEGALVVIPRRVFHITSSRTSKSHYNLLTHFKIFEDLSQNIQFSFLLIDGTDAAKTAHATDAGADAPGTLRYFLVL